MESEMSPDDQAGIMQQVAARREARHAHSQHAVMKQFMTTFANNMRLSVLADSKGDMPEERRQQLIAQAEASKQRTEGDMGAPPPEADGGEEMAPPPPQRRMSSRQSRMLNLAKLRHQKALRMRHTHRLLPEAEGIGFPAPEGMASDPTTDGMVNDPGSTSLGDGPAEGYGRPEEAPAEDEAPPAPPPRRARHHVRMLNMRPGLVEHSKAHRHHARAPQGHKGPHAHKLPPGVVRDEMGRAMPLLFMGSKPAHSGTPRSVCTLAALAITYLFLMRW